MENTISLQDNCECCDMEMCTPECECCTDCACG